jgi:hypothetical protein
MSLQPSTSLYHYTIYSQYSQFNLAHVRMITPIVDIYRGCLNP